MKKLLILAAALLPLFLYAAPVPLLPNYYTTNLAPASPFPVNGTNTFVLATNYVTIVTNTTYLNTKMSGLLVGTVSFLSAVSGRTFCTLNYTNGGVPGLSISMESGGVTNANSSFAFCIPLSTNGTFCFVPSRPDNVIAVSASLWGINSSAANGSAAGVTNLTDSQIARLNATITNNSESNVNFNRNLDVGDGIFAHRGITIQATNGNPNVTVFVTGLSDTNAYAIKYGSQINYWWSTNGDLKAENIFANGGWITNLSGTNIQSGTVSSNSFDAGTLAQLFAAGSGGGGSSPTNIDIANIGTLVVSNGIGSASFFNAAFTPTNTYAGSGKIMFTDGNNVLTNTLAHGFTNLAIGDSLAAASGGQYDVVKLIDDRTLVVFESKLDQAAILTATNYTVYPHSALFTDVNGNKTGLPNWGSGAADSDGGFEVMTEIDRVGYSYGFRVNGGSNNVWRIRADPLGGDKVLNFVAGGINGGGNVFAMSAQAPYESMRILSNGVVRFKFPTVGGGSPSTNELWTSFVAVSDANINLGSTSYGTDNTLALQGLLDQATNGPILIHWDGKYSWTALKYRSNTRISGISGNVGGIQRAAANSPMFKSFNRELNGANTASNVFFENLILNQNGQNQAKFETNFPTYFTTCLDFENVDNFYAENLTIRDSKTFGIFGGGFDTYCQIRGTKGEYSTLTNLNTDLIHIIGSAKGTSTGLIENTIGSGIDDIVCVSGDEFILSGTNYTWSPIGGFKSRVVRNTTAINASQGVRFLNLTNLCGAVTVDGIFGSIGNYAFTYNPFSTNAIYTGNVGSLSVANVHVTRGTNYSPATFTNQNDGYLDMSNIVSVDGHFNSLALHDICPEWTNDNRPIIFLGTKATGSAATNSVVVDNPMYITAGANTTITTAKDLSGKTNVTISASGGGGSSLGGIAYDASMYKVTPQTFTSANTEYQLTFDTTYYSDNVVISNNTFVIPVTGKYHIEAYWTSATTIVAGTAIVYLHVNDTGLVDGQAATIPTGSGNSYTVHYSRDISLIQGDLVTFTGSSATASTVADKTIAQIFKIAGTGVGNIRPYTTNATLVAATTLTIGFTAFDDLSTNYTITSPNDLVGATVTTRTPTNFTLGFTSATLTTQVIEGGVIHK